MKAKITIPIGNHGLCNVDINEIPDLSTLSRRRTKHFPTFHQDSLYFPNSLGLLEDGTPIELVINDIFDTIEAHEHGISLLHLQELFEEVDVAYHLEMLIREGLIEPIQMTTRCVLYKSM